MKSKNVTFVTKAETEQKLSDGTLRQLSKRGFLILQPFPLVLFPSLYLMSFIAVLQSHSKKAKNVDSQSCAPQKDPFHTAVMLKQR